jgi:hypothetical protein
VGGIGQATVQAAVQVATVGGISQAVVRVAVEVDTDQAIVQVDPQVEKEPKALVEQDLIA